MDKHFRYFTFFVTIDITAGTILIQVSFLEVSRDWRAFLCDFLSCCIVLIVKILSCPGAPLKCCQKCRSSKRRTPREKQLCQVALRALEGQRAGLDFMAQGNQIPFLLVHSCQGSWSHGAIYYVLLSCFMPTCCFLRFCPPVPKRRIKGRKSSEIEGHRQSHSMVRVAFLSLHLGTSSI